MLPHIDHDLDVEGDVVLTLENPNAPFAVWSGEDGPWELPRSVPPTLDDETIRSFRQIDPAWREELPPSQWASFGVEPPRIVMEEPPPVDLSNLSVQDTTHVSDLPEETMSEQTGLEEGGADSKEMSPIRFRLSSRHLISASPYFRAILTGPWEESTSRAGSWYSISATDWDQNAFKLLMDIVHGNSQRVPRSMDLELLAKIAVLVDYYKCYDVVKFYADTWIQSLDNPTEISYYSREFYLMLLVSCVFFQRTAFRDLTYKAIQDTQEPLQSLGLPFPEGLLEDIEHIREDTVGKLVGSFRDLLQYLTFRSRCKEECNAALTGSLYRKMSAGGILIPGPERPFRGFSIEGVVQMTKDIRSPIGFWKHGKRPQRDCTCSLGEFLGPLTKLVTDSIQSPELEKYVTNPWIYTANSGPAA